VCIIKIPHKVGALQELLGAIDENGINIEYMYGLSIEADNAYVVLKASDAAAADAVLKANGIETVSGEELIR